jgi:hypothetical protein
MNKELNTLRHTSGMLVISSLAVSFVGLYLGIKASKSIHPPQPVQILCDSDMKSRLDGAGEQLQRISQKPVKKQ